MPMLVSPGVLVTITDESFFIPAQAPTVPLLFIATADEKLQPDNVSLAEGTAEFNVVRAVTSILQSTQLYGIPRFLQSPSGTPHHGDARNEYGLLALNQFLGVGSFAFVIRANVNLDDDLDSLRALWDRKIQIAQALLENLVVQFINDFNTTNGFTPLDVGFKVTVNQSEFLSLAAQALADVFVSFSFRNIDDDYTNNHTATPLDVFANGYDNPPTGSYLGLIGVAIDFVANSLGSVVPTEWTAQEAGNTILGAADDFKFTREFLFQTSLGANNADRKVAIKTAIEEVILGNTEIRSEGFEFNLILAPGCPEVVDAMLQLNVETDEEAMIIGSTPLSFDFQTFAGPSGWSSSVERFNSNNVAYYYPHALWSNFGQDVLSDSSGIALRTYAFNDKVAELWFAPAGIRRGAIVGISNLGIAQGTLGEPTEFVEVHLNRGQRDIMYAYTAAGGVNPLVFFPGRGFLVWGQKTSTQETASALDRVNVRRLMNFIKRALRKGLLPFVFEPNDKITRDSVKAFVDAFLGDLVIRRALFDFATICDESNNTPVRIDRNELWVDIALKPVKAAEFIIVPIRIVSTGATI